MTYTRDQYRNDLNHKILALEDGGYGDFFYDDTDLDLFLDLSLAKLYPAIYAKLVDAGLTLTAYGTNRFSSVTPTSPSTVFMIEDAAERTPVLNWKVSGFDIVNIDNTQGSGTSGTVTSVNVYYHAPYLMPTDDDTDVGLPLVFKPLVVLGALIEALDARQDSGIRGDPAPVGNFNEVSLLDRLIPRYDKLREQLAMGLPGVNF